MLLTVCKLLNCRTLLWIVNTSHGHKIAVSLGERQYLYALFLTFPDFDGFAMMTTVKGKGC